MKIFLVEDEKSLSQLLRSYLVEAGYIVTVFDNGRLAKEAIDDVPDLWILDIMLPEVDGFTLIRSIKDKYPTVPVIFMSARSAELDRVIGLEMGCDDYLPKPFLPRELVLRVNKLLSRQLKQSQVYTVGNYRLDVQARTLHCGDQLIDLTVKEFDVLKMFVEKMNQALSRTDILDDVWGMDYFGSERVVDDTLRRLRKKVSGLPLEAVYGYGYILKESL